MNNNLTKYVANGTTNLIKYKWVGVVKEYTENNAEDGINPSFDSATIQGINVAKIDSTIKKNISISDDEFGKYYVDNKGVVYYEGFLYEGVTYYNKLTTSTSVIPTDPIETDPIETDPIETDPFCIITADDITNNTTTNTTITYRFTWDRPVYGFEVSDIALTYGSKGTFTEIIPNEEYTLVATNSGNGVQTIQIPENICTDDNGKNNLPSNIVIAIQESNIFTNLIAVWNGEYDISWYVTNPSAMSFNISSKEQLAGLALLTAASGKSVYYDANGFANTTGPNLTVGTSFTNQIINITQDIIINNGIFSENSNSFFYTPNGGTTVDVSTLTDANMTYGPRGSTFDGILNGNSHKISGIYSKTTSYPNGLFYTLSGTIKNLEINNSYIYSSGNSSANFASSIISTGIVDSCANINSYIWGYRIAGGITSTQNGLIINSYNNSRIETIIKCTSSYCGSSFIGGICGLSDGYIINSYNTGRIIGGCRTAGILGSQGWQTAVPKVLNCYNAGYITGSTSGVGYGIGWLQGGEIAYTYGLDTYTTQAIGGIESSASIYNSNNSSFSISNASNVITSMNSWISNNGNIYRGVTLSTWKTDTNTSLPILNWQ
ncbi:MAG: hypothetical protein PHH22_01120 [Clostridia bacterium]|nr:hypothetical protein [Clostridia bacterium]